MTQVFILTAGKPEAQQHLMISIEKPIDEETVFGSFASADREELERIREEGNGFYAWGAVPGLRNIPNWETMERGDYVFCVYGSAYRYVARVLAKHDNERFARRVWGEDEDGETWEYMYFLTEPIEVNRPLQEFEGYLRGRYWGFTRISNPELEEIEEDFGSIEGLIREILDYRGEGLPEELTLGTDRSAEIAEDSLRVDDITHGRANDEVIHNSEGRKHIVQHVKYERSQKNRSLAIKIHGTTCAVCKFNFDEVYGSEYAGGYIQIHHVKPLSQHEGKVDPATDMLQVASIGVRVRREAVDLSYTVGPDGEDVRYSVALTRTPCNFGGSRPWFVCPGVVNGVACGRRVAILYGPPGRYFLCRHCYGLSYRSRQESKDFQVTAGNSIVSISWVRRAL